MAQVSSHPIALMRNEFALIAAEHAKFQSELDERRAEVSRNLGAITMIGNIDADLGRKYSRMSRRCDRAPAAKPGTMLAHYQQYETERRKRTAATIRSIYKERQQIDARKESMKRLATMLETIRGPLVELQLPALTRPLDDASDEPHVE